MAAHIEADKFRCPNCRKVKPESDFYRNEGKTHGVSTNCKPCHREIQRRVGRKERERRRDELREAGLLRERWTRESIIEAIQTWASQHGEPPRQVNWRSIKGTPWPSFGVVVSRFGSWNAAIGAAGFAPRQGRPPSRRPQYNPTEGAA